MVDLARGATGRTKILKFDGGFHGNHHVAMTCFHSNSTPSYPEPIVDSSGIPDSVTKEVLISSYYDLERTASIIEANVSARPG